MNIKHHLIEELNHLDTQETFQVWNIVLSLKRQRSAHPSAIKKHPLRGAPVTYHNPTGPVSDNDWDAAQ